MIDPGTNERPTLVLCPMRIEHRAVQREIVRAGLTATRVVQTGVGKEAIIRTLRRELQHESSAARGHADSVILAGACGALRPVGDVPPIIKIIDLHGHEWACPYSVTHAHSTAAATLVAVDEIVSSPADKAALAERTGAAIVDMESHAFAAACQERGLRWHVVRGVSDTPEETLPNEVLGWITPEGNTRAGRAMIDLAMRPRLLPHIAAVVRRSNRVLPLVGAEVVETIRRWKEQDARGNSRTEH